MITPEELVEMREKITLLTKGVEDAIVFNADTGRACLIVDPNDNDLKTIDLEEAIPALRRPEASDKDIAQLKALVEEVNAATKKYIQHYGVFPPEICIH